MPSAPAPAPDRRRPSTTSPRVRLKRHGRGCRPLPPAVGIQRRTDRLSKLARMGLVSFARGIPGPDLLPVDGFGEAARAAVERDGRTILNYGPPGGYGPLREWIAERHDVEPSRVLVTNGSLQGFNFVMRRLLGEGGRAIVEAPSYDRTLLTLRAPGRGSRSASPPRRRPRRRRTLRVARAPRPAARRLHDPDVPEPERPHPVPREPSTSWPGSSASTSCSSTKTTRTAVCASRESIFRRCSS